MGKLLFKIGNKELSTTHMVVHDIINDNKIMIKRDIILDHEFKYSNIMRPLGDFVGKIQHFYYEAVPNFLIDSIYYDDRVPSGLRDLCIIVLKSLIADGYMTNMCGALFTYGDRVIVYINNADYIHACQVVWVRLDKIERDLVKKPWRNRCLIC